MGFSLKAWRRRRVLRDHPLPDALWHATFSALRPLCAGIDSAAQQRLRAWSTLFVHDKAIYGAHGLSIDLSMRLCVAAQACLPLLGLDPDWYADWHSVVLYPDTFVAPRRHIDEAGVVHVERQALIGEAWADGPVILAWPDTRCDAQGPTEPPDPPGPSAPRISHGAVITQAASMTRTGNVVIHECAHQLDQRNGAANGMPPLHRGMSRTHWTEVFSRAYASLSAAVDRGSHHTVLDPYGAQSPAEFFAVASEAFFVQAQRLRLHEPALYRQLALFYRQDPAARLDTLA